MNELLKPEEKTLKDLDGVEHTFIISRLPAVAGREIITQYPTTAVPKVGNYGENEKVMLKLMSYVAKVTPEGNQIRLSTQALVDNHVPDSETLLKLEAAMLSYNTNFFNIGRISKNLNGFAVNIQQLASQILTQLSASSSKKAKPRSKN